MKRRDAIKSITAMVGTAAVATSGAGLLNACKEETYSLKFTPKNLSQKTSLLVQDLSDLLLPKTSTSPGAIDVKVPEFIDMVIGEVVGEEDRKKFNEGSKKYWDAFKNKEGITFDKATPEQKSAFLTSSVKETAEYMQNKQTMNAGESRVEVEEGGKEGEQSAQHHFVKRLKELTMEGFYTSKEIMTVQFKYVPIPGHYQGCVNVQEATGGKAWAL